MKLKKEYYKYNWIEYKIIIFILLKFSYFKNYFLNKIYFIYYNYKKWI